MPRRRNRTTEKLQWTLETLNMATRRIHEDKISIHKAATEFRIPYSTLQKRYNLMIEQTAPRLGRKPIFNKKQEDTLADHLIHMTNIFYGLDTISKNRV